MTKPGTPLQDGPRRHAFLGAAMWTLAVTATLVSGVVAAMTALVPISLDLGESIAAGADPWVTALITGVEFVAIASASVLGMIAWHTRRFKIAALVLVGAAALATLWLATRFVGEYT